MMGAMLVTVLVWCGMVITDEPVPEPVVVEVSE
jgi:hypothetical protein